MKARTRAYMLDPGFGYQIEGVSMARLNRRYQRAREEWHRQEARHKNPRMQKKLWRRYFQHVKYCNHCKNREEPFDLCDTASDMVCATVRYDHPDVERARVRWLRLWHNAGWQFGVVEDE